jgi:hypothetical protein
MAPLPTPLVAGEFYYFQHVCELGRWGPAK